MTSLDSSHGPTMENPPEKERAAPPPLLAPPRSAPTRPAGKAPSSEICERWPPAAPPSCCGGRVKLSWDGFIFLPPLPLAVDG
jgi:hypothetical protein